MPIVERFGPALGARGWVGMRHELAKNEALAETYLEENYFSDGDLKLNSKNILEDYAAGIWDPYKTISFSMQCLDKRNDRLSNLELKLNQEFIDGFSREKKKTDFLGSITGSTLIDFASSQTFAD